jgi:hypothetical protein
MAAGDYQTPAGHFLRAAVRKGVPRRWVCERCASVVKVDPLASRDQATAMLRKAADAHGGEVCP